VDFKIKKPENKFFHKGIDSFDFLQCNVYNFFRYLPANFMVSGQFHMFDLNMIKVLSNRFCVSAVNNQNPYYSVKPGLKSIGEILLMLKRPATLAAYLMLENWQKEG
jgi:hypothetical protein